MPPKLKKPPKNAFYFFMKEHKQTQEAKGYRFPRGMQDVVASAHPLYKQLTPEQKQRYEIMAKQAKEEEKTNMHNKFTISGESFAQINENMKKQEDRNIFESKLVSQLVRKDGYESRSYIMLKTIHSVEEITGHRSKPEYWPLEIALAAFSLKKGLLGSYWTLIDTVRAPAGYASAAKDTGEDTGLPEPGCEEFTERHRNYSQILGKIKQFIIKFTEGNPGPKVIFTKREEMPSAKGCIDWLIRNINSHERQDFSEFFVNLEYLRITQLLVEMSVFASSINASWTSVMGQQKLEGQAERILNTGSYDYNATITCQYHKQNEALKMNVCCQNIVLRRIFLIFIEFVPAFKLQMTDRHLIEKLPKRPDDPTLFRAPGSGLDHGYSQSSATTTTHVGFNYRNRNPIGYTERPSSAYSTASTSSSTGSFNASSSSLSSPTRSFQSSSSAAADNSKRSAEDWDDFSYVPSKRNYSMGRGGGEGTSDFETSSTYSSSSSRTHMTSDSASHGSSNPGMGRGRGISSNTNVRRPGHSDNDDFDDSEWTMSSSSPSSSMSSASSRRPLGFQDFDI